MPTLSILQRQALSGVHAFSGNGKGKHIFWKTVTKDENFMSIFASLGNTYQLSSQTKKALERFVCCLYGFKKLNSVNEVQRMYVLAETCEQLQ